MLILVHLLLLVTAILVELVLIRQIWINSINNIALSPDNEKKGQ